MRMILSTIHTVPGREIAEIIGLVRGNTVRARNVGCDRFANNLALKARVSASATRINGKSCRFIAVHLIDGNPETYWAADDGIIESPIELAWEHPQTIQ
jgi:hypothetical protein